jgi:hypothetical protein
MNLALLKPVFVLLLSFLQLLSFSQGLSDSLVISLSHVRNNQPSDQLFLHLDRNLYHPGDTIRFQAYVRDRKTGIIGSESISLYSLLLNQAHKTIDSARFRIIFSTSSGWLKIPPKTPSGNYSVLAYTSMMMNYDPEFVFSTPVRIDEPETSLPETDQIDEKKTSRSFRAPLSQSDVDLRFLPEGGTFVYNISQRLAFNAVTSTGRTLKVTGIVSNQQGVKVSEFKSGQFGPGIIEFSPTAGDTYFASLYGEEFFGMKWPLPIPDKSGIVIRVVNNSEGEINILLKENGVEDKDYLLAITMNNALILSQDVRLDSIFRLSINTEELPAGTAYITLYDNELNPVAERLVFVNDNKKMKIEINSTSTDDPGSITDLILNTTDDQGESISSIVSLAVIDSASGFCNSLPFADIESAFLYDKDFYNKLPGLIKLQGLNNIDKETIDLLLMTYGWRKFTLKEISGIGQDKKLLDYDYIKISNLNPPRKGRLDIQIMTLEDASVLTLPVNRDKETVIQYSSLNDSVRQFMIMANENSMRNLNSAKIEFPENIGFTDKAKREYRHSFFYNNNSPILEFDNSSGVEIPVQSMKEFYLLPDSVIDIEEVTIKARRPPPPHVYVNKYERLYGSGSIRTKTSKDFAVWPSLEFILQGFSPIAMDKIKKMIYLRSVPMQGSFPALFVLDDVPIGSSYEMIDMISPSEIESITVLRGSQGFTRYGFPAIGGVVFINTKPLIKTYRYETNDDLMKHVRLFRSEIEFYIPSREDTDTTSVPQCYPTILWESEIFLDGEGPVRIPIPENIVKGTALVFVNGVSLKNNIGSGSYRYFAK